ncbi:MAG: hypothetical protein AAGF20_07540 [Pseudomonadota bacterium]
MTCMTAIFRGQIIVTDCAKATIAECEAEKPAILAAIQSAFPDKVKDLQIICTAAEEG